LISDVTVPKPSETDVAVELVKSHPAMPILFVSGTPMYDWEGSDLRNFQELPRDRVGFLEKPFPAAVLLEKVSGLLETNTYQAAFRDECTTAKPLKAEVALGGWRESEFSERLVTCFSSSPSCPHDTPLSTFPLRSA
jgi:FixJ family two-component response regulator